MMKINDTLYNTLNYLVKYILPGFGTFYLTISQIWNLPYGEQVLGTVVALATLIGVTIGIAKAQYKGDGEVVLHEDDATLMLNKDNQQLREGQVLSVKVHDTTPLAGAIIGD